MPLMRSSTLWLWLLHIVIDAGGVRAPADAEGGVAAGVRPRLRPRHFRRGRGCQDPKLNISYLKVQGT